MTFSSLRGSYTRVQVKHLNLKANLCLYKTYFGLNELFQSIHLRVDISCLFRGNQRDFTSREVRFRDCTFFIQCGFCIWHQCIGKFWLFYIWFISFGMKYLFPIVVCFPYFSSPFLTPCQSWKIKEV